MLSTKDQELKQDQKEMEQPTTRHGQVESQLREESQDEQFLNLEHKHIQPLAGKDQIAGEMKNLFNASYTCSISEPGLSTTANHQTHVIVELSDASGQPCSVKQNVTAELWSSSEPTNAGTWWWPWSKKASTTVSMKSPSQTSKVICIILF